MGAGLAADGAGAGGLGDELSASDDALLAAGQAWEGADEAEPRRQQLLRALSVVPQRELDALTAALHNSTAGLSLVISPGRVCTRTPVACCLLLGAPPALPQPGCRLPSSRAVKSWCAAHAGRGGLQVGSRSAIDTSRRLASGELAPGHDAALPADGEALEELLGAGGGSHARPLGLALPAGYVGSSKQGLRHGLGCQQWGGEGGEGGEEAARQGVWYAGEFADDVPRGLGALRFDDGALYVGACLAGQPHGWGYIQERSRHLVGAFRRGLPHGRGVLQLMHAARPAGPRYAVVMREGVPVRARALAPLATAAAAGSWCNTSSGARVRAEGAGKGRAGWWLTLPGTPPLGDMDGDMLALPCPIDGSAVKAKDDAAMEAAGRVDALSASAGDSEARQGQGEVVRQGLGSVADVAWWDEALRVVREAQRVSSSARRLYATQDS